MKYRKNEADNSSSTESKKSKIGFPKPEIAKKQSNHKNPYYPYHIILEKLTELTLAEKGSKNNNLEEDIVSETAESWLRKPLTPRSPTIFSTSSHPSANNGSNSRVRRCLFSNM